MIRSAVREDAAALGRLHVETWQTAYRGDFPDEFLDGLDIERRVEWFGGAIDAEQEILVAEADGVVAGFSSFGSSRSSDWGEIYAIYVHPDHWGEGHGFDLLTASESRLVKLGFSRVMLWVLSNNLRARGFYERQGWRAGGSIQLEEIGGVHVTEVRYEKTLLDAP